MLLQQYRNGTPALLVLADGSVFQGESIGAPGHAVAEVVFNTAMTGYQEILTDPSYCRQMVTMTYPHIGNVGVNTVDCESDRIWVSGLIIRDLAPTDSSWRGDQSLQAYLKEHHIVAIAGIDTRRLTRLLRDKGAQPGCIMEGSDVDAALALAQSFAGISGQDLAKEVSCRATYAFAQGTYHLDSNSFQQGNEQFHVVVYDFGVKKQILRLLVDRHCRLTVVPATTPVEAVLKLKPDGVLLSNGPGDPAACAYAIEHTQRLLKERVPLMGICLGFQILALACGAKTKK